MKKDNILESASGLFVCDAENYAYEFYPSLENMVGESTIRNLIIPEGVIGFAGSFCRYLTVVEQFSIPNTVKSIGSNWYTKEYYPNGAESSCVFANCNLPTVILPENLKLLGTFAFGNCKIDTLCLPANYRSWKCRNFRAMKGTHVNRLFVPDVFQWRDIDMIKNWDITPYLADMEISASEPLVYRERKEGELPQDFLSWEEYCAEC